MRPRRRHSYDPLRDLIRALRVAAAQIDTPRAREIAAREADRIPLTRTEKAHGAKAKIAALARCQMRRLPMLEGQAVIDAKAVLIGCADALASDFRPEPEPRPVARKGRRDGNPARMGGYREGVR